MAAGYAAGVSIEVKDEKMTNRSRKIKFFLDKMKAQENQTDSVAKLVKDLIVRKAITWVKAAAPIAKIILVHKERLMKFMKHSARVPGSNKIVEKKFVRIGEGSMTYSIGHHRFIEMARAAGAIYKIGEAKGNTILINLSLEI